MDNATTITKQFILEFAKLNLAIVQNMASTKNYDPELLREIRESAQVLTNILS